MGRFSITKCKQVGGLLHPAQPCRHRSRVQSEGKCRSGNRTRPAFANLKTVIRETAITVRVASWH